MVFANAEEIESRAFRELDFFDHPGRQGRHASRKGIGEEGAKP